VGCAASNTPLVANDLAGPPNYDFAFPGPLHDFAMPDLYGADLYGTPSDMPPGNCPTGTIPSSVNTLYAGDTTGAANLVTDTRTSWTTAPDHALLFVAPKAGTYQVSLTSTNQTGTQCGVVLRQYGSNNDGPLLDENSCPSMGSTTALDAAYAATPGLLTTNIALSNAQHVMMYVSCAQTAATPTIVYKVSVVFQ
jgi:hypothetical protein